MARLRPVITLDPLAPRLTKPRRGPTLRDVYMGRALASPAAQAQVEDRRMLMGHRGGMTNPQIVASVTALMNDDRNASHRAQYMRAIRNALAQQIRYGRPT